MRIVSQVLLLVVALIHLWFMILEMFLWDHPLGQKIFAMTPEVSASSAVLAANQGLYNGLLALGLLWALVTDRFDLKCFFLGCVIVAGVYGGITAKSTILLAQALPGLLALLAVAVAPPTAARKRQYIR